MNKYFKKYMGTYLQICSQNIVNISNMCTALLKKKMARMSWAKKVNNQFIK